MDFEEWLETGHRNGWCGAPVCVPHDGIPTTEEEDEDIDMCLHVVRLYVDDDERRNVEANHAPSLWRGSNRGWGR